MGSMYDPVRGLECIPEVRDQLRVSNRRSTLPSSEGDAPWLDDTGFQEWLDPPFEKEST